MTRIRINDVFKRALIAGIKRSDLEILRFENLQGLKIVDDVVRVNITLCPLYTGKTLEDSDLLPSGTSLTGMRQSRVYNKLLDGFTFIQSLKESLRPIDTKIFVQFTFADTGVLLNHEPGTRDERNILHHLWLYRKAIRDSTIMKDVHWDLTCYSKHNDRVLPKFLRQKPVSARTLARRLFTDLTQPVLSLGCFDSSMVNKQTHSINKSGAAIIASLVDAFGRDTARALIIQYGFYDAITAGPDDLNLFFERGPLLLNLTDLFPHKNYPRVDILCR